MTAPMRWQVGDVTITRVEEMLVPGLPIGVMFGDFESGDLERHRWLERYVGDNETMPLSFHTYAVAAGERRVLVDTCCGNAKPRTGLTGGMFGGLDTPFLDRLAEAGFPAEEVDTVICTHLHVDHVGWNTRLDGDRWVPTFPNARYLFVDRDFEYWADRDEEMHAASYADSVRPVHEAGLVDLVPPDHAVSAEIRLVPTPGHTPGHASVCIESAGASAVVTGDLAHHPLQLAIPERSSFADTDGELAARTRNEFVDAFAGTGTLVLGTHFWPPAGLLDMEGGGCILHETPGSPA
ncbi:MAG TPA: MBL fold metallo-hydrolase [Acidimicrobiales bacterium]|nr:MBL fold metallo-hydrolase [Acidimicrobiales bacterium]